MEGSGLAGVKPKEMAVEVSTPDVADTVETDYVEQVPEAEVTPEIVEPEKETEITDEKEVAEKPAEAVGKPIYDKVIKINGEDKHIIIEKAEDLERFLSLAYGLQSKQRKLNQERNDALAEVQSYKEYLKSNPRQLLEKEGVDLSKIADEVFLEKFREQNMSPEEKQLRQENRRVKDLEQRLSQVEGERTRAEMLPKLQNLEAQLVKTAESLKIPTLPKNMRAIYDEYMNLRSQGLEATWEEAGRIVADEYFGERPISETATVDEVKKYFGKSYESIKKAVIADIKGAKEPVRPDSFVEAEPSNKSESKNNTGKRKLSSIMMG
jgi:hypothetical protein